MSHKRETDQDIDDAQGRPYLRSPKIGLCCFTAVNRTQLADRYSLVHPDGRLADPFARCGEHRVCDGWRDRRHGRFADSHRMLGAGYDVNLDLWCFVDTEHLIVMEVALLHASTVKRDLTLESSTEPEDDSAFRLSHNAVRINNTAAVNRGHHTMNANRIRLADRNFRDFSNVRVKRKMQGNTASLPFRERGAPMSFLRC